MHVCPECGTAVAAPGFCPADGSPLAPASDPVLGTEVLRYRVARLLGEGGMGKVYLGVQPQIGSRVAIKILSPQCAQSPDLLERFFAEGRAVNLIRHEHIISVLDMAQLPDGRPLIVMEFVDGVTLSAVVRGGRAPLGGVVRVLGEVLSALDAAHAIGIVHRDVKPDNILITPNGHAKVLDFGIAKLAPELSHALSPRTRTGAMLGTPSYMAPEQISGGKAVDARTDVYAAGVMLFEAVTGRLPFVGETLFDLMRAHVDEAPPSPRALRPQLPEAMEHVILTALAKDPAERFQSAAAMANALDAASAALPPDEWRELAARRPASRASRPTNEPTPQQPQPLQSPTPVPTPIALSMAQSPAASSALTAARTAAPAPRRKVRGAVIAIASVATVAGAAAVGYALLGTGSTTTTTQTQTQSAVIALAAPADAASAPTPSPTPSPSPSPSPSPTASPSPSPTPSPTASPSPSPSPTASPSPSPTPSSSQSRAPVVVHHPAREHVDPLAPLHPDEPAEPPATLFGPTDVAPAATRLPTAAHPLRVGASFDARHFDYAAFAGVAGTAARKLMPDAQLVAMELHDTFPDGHVDLTAGTGASTFTFRSQHGADTDGVCILIVEVRASGVSLHANPTAMCMQSPTALPRCPLTYMWEQARAKGTHATHAAAWIAPNHGWQFAADDLRWDFDCP
jgi:serine/threonine-protein kinase